MPLPLDCDIACYSCTLRWSVYSHDAAKLSGPRSHLEGLGVGHLEGCRTCRNLEPGPEGHRCYLTLMLCLTDHQGLGGASTSGSKALKVSSKPLLPPPLTNDGIGGPSHSVLHSARASPGTVHLD